MYLSFQKDEHYILIPICGSAPGWSLKIRNLKKLLDGEDNCVNISHSRGMMSCSFYYHATM